MKRADEHGLATYDIARLFSFSAKVAQGLFDEYCTMF